MHKKTVNLVVRHEDEAVKERSACGHSYRLLSEVEEYDGRRVADGCVFSGELQCSQFLIHPKNGNVVAALITGVWEFSGWIEIETARVVAPGPLIGDEGQLTVLADREDPNAIV